MLFGPPSLPGWVSPGSPWGAQGIDMSLALCTQPTLEFLLHHVVPVIILLSQQALNPHNRGRNEGVHVGPSEGVFGWVAANYASGALQGYALKQGLRLRRHTKPSAPFVGVFELGGASAQVHCLTPCRGGCPPRSPQTEIDAYEEKLSSSNQHQPSLQLKCKTNSCVLHHFNT